mgnify:CR=1 FL=1
MMSGAPKLILYTYWRSTAAWRVRIALHLKGLSAELRPVHLLRGGGEQHAADYVRLQPQHLVPVLIHQGRVLRQSLAIIEYLEEVFSAPPLLPADPQARAACRAFAQVIAGDLHPLNNLRVLNYLRDALGAGDDARLAWYHHWLAAGFSALEALLEDDSPCVVGGEPTLADCCLLPQVYNAERFSFDLTVYPRVRRVAAHLRTLPAFVETAPAEQPDAEA